MAARPLLRIAGALDAVNRAVGGVVRWLALGMMLVQLAVVVLRYVFGTSFVWAQELVVYQHAALFMLAGGYTLLVDQHVRVDIFYSRFGPRGRALVDLVGTLVFLLPFVLVLLVWTWPSVRRSWQILEGAISVGGIPASFLLKSLIPAFALLLLIQGVSWLCSRLAVLLAPSEAGGR